MQRPFRSQSPYRVGSGPFGPFVSLGDGMLPSTPPVVAAVSSASDLSDFVLSAFIFIYMPADTSKNKRGRNASRQHHTKEQTHTADQSAKIIACARNRQPALQSKGKAGGQNRHRATPRQPEKTSRNRPGKTNACDRTKITTASKKIRQAGEEAHRCPPSRLF